MTSVVIAAHNEAAVIGRCLDALLADGPLDVVVVANGCTDDTARVAARPGVTVLDLPEPGKTAALNAGDAAATSFPRIYLDADIVLSPGSVPALVAALAEPGGPLAVMPARTLDVRGRPLAVRAFYAINGRLPVYRRALFGRGTMVLSAAGRARFGEFPAVTADDLFLDALFTDAEKREVPAASALVGTPRRTADLIGRLVRVRAGNAALRADGGGVRSAARSSWLRDVVLPRPWLAPAAACYVVITLVAALKARGRTPAGWGHDRSSRVVEQENHG